MNEISMGMSHDLGMHTEVTSLQDISYQTFQEMGPPTAFLDHLGFENFWSSVVLPNMIGKPSEGVGPSNETILIIGGEATAGKTKLASQLFYSIDHNPALAELIEKYYICLATTAYYSRLISGRVTRDHGHGQYQDDEYNGISEDAYQLAQGVLKRPRTPSSKHRLIAVEFSSAAYIDQSGQLQGSNRLFTTARNLVTDYPMDSFGVFIDQADEVSDINKNFRDEMEVAAAEEVPGILARYQIGVIKNGKSLKLDRLSRKISQEVLNFHRLTATPRRGVERNHAAFEETRRRLGLRYHPREDVWWRMGASPEQLGIPQDHMTVLCNRYISRVLPINLDILRDDLAWQELIKNPDIINNDPIAQAQGIKVGQV